MIRTATRTRHVPAGSVKVTDKSSDAVAYLYDLDGRAAVCAYVGKQTKPALWAAYNTAASRERAVRDLFAGRQRAAAYKAERKAELAKPHKLQLGHILVSSWGYDQTNIDWYEVTAIVGDHTVEIRKIASNIVEGAGSDHGRCFPTAGAFTGEPRRVRVTDSSVKVGHQRAWLWDGRGRSWSSWH